MWRQPNHLSERPKPTAGCLTNVNHSECYRKALVVDGNAELLFCRETKQLNYGDG